MLALARWSSGALVVAASSQLDPSSQLYTS
jgi:hypothetical protein